MLTNDEDFHASPLWTFSLQHYAKPGVQPACLALQDTAGLDVNVALACLWHERRGRAPLSEEDMVSLLKGIAVQKRRADSIRSVRRDARDAADAQALYRALQRAELLAENLLQLGLYGALRSWPDGPKGDGRASLRAYAANLRTTLPPDAVEAFVVE